MHVFTLWIHPYCLLLHHSWPALYSQVNNCTEITVQSPVLISLLLEYDLSDTMSGDKWYLYKFINACHATASTPIITKSASFSYRKTSHFYPSLSLPARTHNLISHTVLYTAAAVNITTKTILTDGEHRQRCKAGQTGRSIAFWVIISRQNMGMSHRSMDTEISYLASHWLGLQEPTSCHCFLEPVLYLTSPYLSYWVHSHLMHSISTLVQSFTSRVLWINFAC